MPIISSSFAKKHQNCLICGQLTNYGSPDSKLPGGINIDYGRRKYVICWLCCKNRKKDVIKKYLLYMLVSITIVVGEACFPTAFPGIIKHIPETVYIGIVLVSLFALFMVIYSFIEKTKRFGMGKIDKEFGPFWDEIKEYDKKGQEALAGAISMLVKYIEQNYSNKEFKADMISEVDKEYLEYIEYFTSGVYWIDSNPHQYAVETLLSELKRKGLIKQKNSEDGSEILYVLAYLSRKSSDTHGEKIIEGIDTCSSPNGRKLAIRN